MGRTVFAEEHLNVYLTSISADGYTIGLILGQSSSQRDYVIHLAKTPPPQTKNVVEETLIASTTDLPEDEKIRYIANVNDIPEIWVADHAKHVTRMLPGGMFVLGIFIVGPSDTLSDNKSVHKFRSILGAIRKSLSGNKYLYGNSTMESLILSFNSVTGKYVCKAVDITKDGILRPVDWKFRPKPTQWHQLHTVVEFDRLFFIEVNKSSETLKKQLQDILEDISQTVDSAVVVIEGENAPTDATLETLRQEKKDMGDCRDGEDSSEKPLEVNLYIPCPNKTNEDSTNDVNIISCSASIRLLGQLVSKTFVHSNAIVEEAITAIKQDIVRSLASRLEMHWDSLIEEENGSPEENITLHEPPRRVLVALPNSRITLSDYLFPGEGPQEALLSLQELLDLDVHENEVQKEIEVQADPMEFYCQNEAEAMPSEDGKNEKESNQMSICITAGLGVALIILLIAIIIHQLS